jgi:hypothetical protein
MTSNIWLIQVGADIFFLVLSFYHVQTFFSAALQRFLWIIGDRYRFVQNRKPLTGIDQRE